VTVLEVRTCRHTTNGGTVENFDIRHWPTVVITVDGDITFMWHEFLGSRYRISSYTTGGPWDRDPPE
jgi:hypothetical protein